jgi:hypothetical protein
MAGGIENREESQMRKCPHCGEEVDAGAMICRNCFRAIRPGETAKPPAVKRCPYCAEEIHGSAIVCKHCGRELVANPAYRSWTAVAGLSLGLAVIGLLCNAAGAGSIGGPLIVLGLVGLVIGLLARISARPAAR